MPQGCVIVVVRLNGDRVFYGTEQRPRRKAEKCTPFKDEPTAFRSWRRVLSKKKQNRGGDVTVSFWQELPHFDPHVWTPFQAAETGQATGPDAIDRPPDSVWVNSRYTVFKYDDCRVSGADLVHGPLAKPDAPAVVHLSIKRNDRGVVHDWRDLQRIKNELVGPECSAIEMYPPEHLLVDCANQFHLWVFSDPTAHWPVGWRVGRVVDKEERGKTRQRPFDQDEERTVCGACADHVVSTGGLVRVQECDACRNTRCRWTVQCPGCAKWWGLSRDPERVPPPNLCAACMKAAEAAL